MKQPGVLLLSPGIIKSTDQDFGLPHLVSLGGVLQQRLGVRVEIIDLAYEGGDHRHLQRLLESLGPFALIGVSCYSSYDYMRVASLGHFLKRLYPDVPLVAGGYHASAEPEDLVADGQPFDSVIVGEAELGLTQLVETVLGGASIERGVIEGELVQDLDSLPPYQWQLLNRYWPHAKRLGRKLQIYLARGCPYHCTFCMERAKGEYRWRALSPERAVDELQRLAQHTELGHWIVNIADPLFGFNRTWRRQVLQGILDAGLKPYQFWTLTRADSLDEQDVELFARNNFSIGIGVESGSPDMLRIMQKVGRPERYLEALLRLAELSLKHQLNWAANIVVGHPGETRRSMEETHTFLQRLFSVASQTCGWLSVDPFRLYPGSQVQQQLTDYEQQYGAHFFHPRWWTSWYDASFRAEHLDPSAELDYATRVELMYQLYAPMAGSIIERFRGQGTEVDRIFERSLSEQAELLSDNMCQLLLQRARSTPDSRRDDRKTTPDATQQIAFPLGLRIRDPWVRRREEAVRRLLELGLLKSERLVEALLITAPESFLDEEQATQLLDDHNPEHSDGAASPTYLGIATLTLALEGLAAGAGERVADLMASSGYIAALLSHMVGEEGHVLALHPGDAAGAHRLAAQLRELPNVELQATTVPWLDGLFDAIWIGAALPRLPPSLLWHVHEKSGRVVTFLGPRFRLQDLVCLRRDGQRVDERVLGRARVPVAQGLACWLASA